MDIFPYLVLLLGGQLHQSHEQPGRPVLVSAALLVIEVVPVCRPLDVPSKTRKIFKNIQYTFIFLKMWHTRKCLRRTFPGACLQS